MHRLFRRAVHRCLLTIGLSRLYNREHRCLFDKQPMEKKDYRYRLALDLKSPTEQEKHLELDFEVCHELFGLMDGLRSKKLFRNDEELAAFVIGLKLFSKVMVRHADNPLFAEMNEAYRPFMMKLKRL